MPLIFLDAIEADRLARLLRSRVPPDPADRAWVDAFVARLEANPPDKETL